MTLDALGDPPRPARQKILKEEHVRIYHVVDVLSRCCRIMENGQVSIDRGFFLMALR